MALKVLEHTENFCPSKLCWFPVTQVCTEALSSKSGNCLELLEWYYIELTVPWPVLPKLAFSWASLVDWILSSTAAPGYQGSGVTPWEHFGSSSPVIRGTWKCTAVYPSSIQNTCVIMVLLGILNLYLNLNSIFPLELYLLFHLYIPVTTTTHQLLKPETFETWCTLTC